MTKSAIKDFTKGNITGQLIVFSLPLFLSNLLQIVYNMVDMVVVGAVCDKAGISAVSIGGDVVALLTFVGMGFGGAGQVLIARYVGAGQREKIGKFVGTMTAFLTIATLIISALGLIFRHPILTLMNTPDEAYDWALEYSVVCMLGLIFIYGYNIVSAILRGMGDSKHPFIFIAIAAAVNVLLDILLVVVIPLGPMGAAIATVSSQGVSFVSSLVFLMLKRERFGLEVGIRDFLHFEPEMLSALVKLGTPMAIKTASIQFSKLFVNAWINGYGLEVSAFAGIANKISAIANLISSAMNTAGSTMVGQNIAAGKFDRVKKILANLAVITLFVAAVLSAVMLIIPEAVYSLFSREAEVVAVGEGFVPIAVLLFVAGALRAVMNALINGSGNYKINFVTAILDGVVMRIGLSLLFGLALGMEHYGFWLGDALAGFTPFLIGVGFYFTGLWKRGACVADTEEK